MTVEYGGVLAPLSDTAESLDLQYGGVLATPTAPETGGFLTTALTGLTGLVREAVPLVQAYTTVKTAGEPQPMDYAMGGTQPLYRPPFLNTQAGAAVAADRPTFEAAERGAGPGMGVAIGGGSLAIVLGLVAIVLLMRGGK